MREAIGSTFLFNIMIVFIFFFASFLAIAINYSQSFRVKNQVINYIEQYEGMHEETSIKEITDYIKDSGYYRRDMCNCESNNYECDGDNGSSVTLDGYTPKGLCIKQLKNGNGDTYYRVTTYVTFNLPIIGEFFTFPVKGETKIITNPTS